MSLTAALLAALFLSVSGCRQAANADLIDREAFIGTYVDLRVEALRNRGELQDDSQDRVLFRHDVTAEDLHAFIRGHGAELGFMRDLWNEIESRLDSVPPMEP